MQMGMNRIILIPNKCKALLHPTICIMNHITLSYWRKRAEKCHKKEWKWQQNPTKYFVSKTLHHWENCIFDKCFLARWTSGVIFSVTMTNFFSNTDLFAQGAAFRNVSFIFCQSIQFSEIMDIITPFLGFL